MRILCPTYWYPEHAKDIHATYVHDINRHLVRLGHEVLVITPRIGDAAKRESFDGVEIVRFPASIPEDLSYGKVAQSKIGIVSKARRLAAMGSYLVKQYAHTVAEGNGPVNALDTALRKALIDVFPQLAGVKLVDYKARYLHLVYSYL